MTKIEKQVIHLRNKEPVANMKLLLIILLAVACQAYTPITERSVYYSAHEFGRNNHGPMTELNTNTSEYLTEAIHIMVCNQYKNKYIKLLKRIETIKRNITYKIEKVMPRLMLNENAIIYGKETQSDASRQKRAIPLGLILLV